jgi:hypothetical protein
LRFYFHRSKVWYGARSKVHEKEKCMHNHKLFGGLR